MNKKSHDDIHSLESSQYSVGNTLKCLGVLTPWFCHYSRLPSICIIAYLLVEWDIAQEIQIMLFASLFRACRTKYTSLMVTLRADERRHVLDHTENLLLVRRTALFEEWSVDNDK